MAILLLADVRARGDIVAGGARGVLSGGGGAVWLVLSGAAGAEDGRQKSVIVGVRAGCRAVDGDIVAGGARGVFVRRRLGRFGYELSADVQARGDIVAGGARGVFVRRQLGRFGWFYLVRRERRTDGRKASSLACGRVAEPLMAILLPAGPVKLVLPSRLAVL